MTRDPETPSRLSFMDAYAMARRIAMQRASPSPPTWSQIAEIEGVSVSTARTLHRKLMESAEDTPDSKDLVDEHVFMFSQVIEEMAWLVEHGDNSAAKIGAAKLLVDTAVRRIELLQAAGRVPRRLYLAEPHTNLAAMAEQMAEVLGRYNLPEEAIVELRAVVRAHDPKRRLAA